jgi:hypothetical protein
MRCVERSRLGDDGGAACERLPVALLLLQALLPLRVAARPECLHRPRNGAHGRAR